MFQGDLEIGTADLKLLPAHEHETLSPTQSPLPSPPTGPLNFLHM